MDTHRLLACLRQDGARLAAAAEGHLDAPVPNCPGWVVRDALLHVADVYQHKIVAIREGKQPYPWPPDFGDVEPMAHFQSSFEALLAEFAAHSPDDPAWTWGIDEGTVGWWIRRMAQETAVHRIDVEQAVGVATPIDIELAIDGVDEMLALIIPAVYTSWPQEFTDLLADTGGEVVAVRTGGREWRIGMQPSGLTFSDDGPPVATVDGEPEAVLLWLWGRLTDDAVTVGGDAHAIEALRRVLSAAGQ